MRHPIRGFLIGPVVAPLAYWIGAMVHAWIIDFRISWIQALRELMVIAGFGMSIAYAVALVWGAPAVYVLHRLGWLRASTVILTGTLGGTIVAVLFAFLQQGALFQVHMPLLGGAVLGALAGGTFWWTGQGKAESNGPAA